MVKMEFGDKALQMGDPPKVDCSPDNPAEINYTETINVSYDDAIILDEIAQKPVVCMYSNLSLDNVLCTLALLGLFHAGSNS